MTLMTHWQLTQVVGGTDADIDDRLAAHSSYRGVRRLTLMTLAAHPGYRAVLRLTLLTDWHFTRIVVGY